MRTQIQKAFCAQDSKNGKHGFADATTSSAVQTDRNDRPVKPRTVSRWVDYSKKYGLGYQMSDGTRGVFFNDATKLVAVPLPSSFPPAASSSSDYFYYLRRVVATSSSAQTGDNNDVRRAKRDIVEFSGVREDTGPELEKKLLLFDHFQAYLSSPDDDDSEEPSAPERPSEVMCANRGDDDDGDDDMAPLEPPAYVRKWMHTRHAIIFRMSNNDFQVNFFDGTQVILWSNARHGTFLSKSGTLETFELSSPDVLAIDGLAKRLKYVKDLLSRLLTDHHHHHECEKREEENPSPDVARRGPCAKHQTSE